MAKQNAGNVAPVGPVGIVKKLDRGFDGTPLKGQAVTLPSIPGSVADALAAGLFDSEATILRAAYSAAHGKMVSAVKAAATAEKDPITTAEQAQTVVDGVKMTATRTRTTNGENKSAQARRAATEKALLGSLAAIGDEALRAMALSGAITSEWAEAQIARRSGK